jgi:hypothetical protein
VVADEDIVIEVARADRADEGLELWLVVLMLQTLAHTRHPLGVEQGRWNLAVEPETTVETLPNAAQLGEGTEEGTLDFVEVVVESVGKLYEGTVFALDGQLNFAEDVAVLEIDEDVVGAKVQPVGDPHQGDIALPRTGLPKEFVVDADDFLFARGALATEEVHDVEGDEGEVELEGGVVFAELGGGSQETVDEPVEVFDGVGVQVVDDVQGVLGSNQLVFLDVVAARTAQFPPQQVALHHEVVLQQLPHLPVDLSLLLPQQLLQHLLHVLPAHVRQPLVPQLDSLHQTVEVSKITKLPLQLLAPLRNQPQDLRILDHDAMSRNLFISEGKSRIRQLFSYFELSIGLHLLAVFSLVDQTFCC